MNLSAAPALLDRLQYNELFGLFPSHIRTQLISKAETKIFKSGSLIFKRGEEGPWMAAILAGRIRMCVHSIDGKEMLLTMVERGEIFGERALLDGLPRAADAIADGDTTCLIVKRDDIMPLLFNYPEAMYGIVKMLCHRMLRYTSTLELYALENLATRLARMLLDLAGRYGTEEEGRIIIRSGLNQADLGHQLASSRESINKQLKAFARKGYLTLAGNEIILLDVTALEKICQPGEIA